MGGATREGSPRVERVVQKPGWWGPEPARGVGGAIWCGGLCRGSSVLSSDWNSPAYCFSSCGHLLIVVSCHLCEGAAFKLFPGSMHPGLAVISKRIIFLKVTRCARQRLLQRWYLYVSFRQCCLFTVVFFWCPDLFFVGYKNLNHQRENPAHWCVVMAQSQVGIFAAKKAGKISAHSM